jgi:hypothetical protein
MAQVPNARALTEGDGLNDYFNVNTVTKQIQVPNGASIVMYSDAYQTVMGQMSSGTFGGAVSATSPDPGASGTIATAGVGVALVTPAAARAGIILQPGTFNGQEVWIVNQAAAGNNLTLNVTPATSNVADSATESAINGLNARKYVWIGGTTNLWYRAN